MHFFSKIIYWLISLFIISLVLLLVSTFIAIKQMGLDMRAVTSSSMTPSIPIGALVVIQPVNIETILPGEIITFQSPEVPNAVVTHRVREVTVRGGNRVFRTQGDANDDPDLELVPASSVLGRVVINLPFLGYLSQFIRSRRGWFLIVIIPAMTLIIIELINVLKLIWFSDEKSGIAA